jgi:hypothetical protein
MGCYLGWYSTVGCPLRGEEENKYKKGASGPPKTIKKKTNTWKQLCLLKGCRTRPYFCSSYMVE